MRKFATIAMVLLLAVAFVACDNNNDAEPTGYAPNQSAEAYMYIHGGYVGQATATTNADGDLSVQLDEAFLPHTLAAVDIDSDEWSEDNTASYVVRGNQNFVAKYVEYDGTVYVGTTVGTSVTYVAAGDDGEPAGNQDLELLIVRGQASMANYFDVIQNGGFATLTEFGGTATPVTTTSYGSVTKRGSDYWNFGALGWQGNIDAIEEFIAEEGFAYSVDELQRATEEDADGLRHWSVADAVTGATLSDFEDYFVLAQSAAAAMKSR